MHLGRALHGLATARRKLPREAMRWALDHWDEAGPRLVAMLDAYADGTDRSEAAADTLFFALHLMAEKADPAAFAPLCRLLCDPRAPERILGDGITGTLPGILVSTYGGDLAPLQQVIEAPEADQFVRHGAFLALTYLARIGRVPDAEMRGYLLRLHAGMQPRSESFAWVGWLSAVSSLGYGDLAGHAEELFQQGFIDPDVMELRHFQEDLKHTLDGPGRRVGFMRDDIKPFTDAIGMLGQWHGFQDPLPRAAAAKPSKAGRNDPCPCGSGKKYKKCCLNALETGPEGLAVLR